MITPQEIVPDAILKQEAPNKRAATPKRVSRYEATAHNRQLPKAATLERQAAADLPTHKEEPLALEGNEPEHLALVKLTSKKEMTANKMHQSILKFVEVRAEPRSLHVALASAQSLIKMVSLIKTPPPPDKCVWGVCTFSRPLTGSLYFCKSWLGVR